MWTRVPAPLIASDQSVVPSCCCLLALDDLQESEAEAEVLSEAFSLRLPYNHQLGEQEQQLEYTTKHIITLAIDNVSHLSSISSQPTTHNIHHDQPEAACFFKRFTSTKGFTARKQLPLMSTPEGARRGRQQQQQQVQLVRPEGNVSSFGERLGGVSATDRRQRDDMQTQFGNAKHTLLNASDFSDQEVPELLVVPTVSKKRRVIVLASSTHDETVPIPPKDSPHSLDQDHSGVTHMADLDSSSKASTPEDIDSQVPASPVAAAAAAKSSYEIAAKSPQCSSTPPQGKQSEIVTEQERCNKNVEYFDQSQARQSDPQPSDDDDTQSTSQIRCCPVPHLQSRYASKRTMAGHGSDEWLQLSLGSGVQSEDQTQAEDNTQPSDHQSPTRTITPPTSTDPVQGSIRDFFRFGPDTEPVQRGRTYTSSPVTPRHRQQHQYSGTPESSSHRSGVPISRPLTFLEPRPRSSRDYSPWGDPVVMLPRVPSCGNVGIAEPGQFLSPPPVLQRPPSFSNLATLPYHPARVLQPMRGEQTETTTVRVSPWAGMAGMGMGMGVGVQHPHHEAPRTPPNPAELLSIPAPGAFRDWRSVPPTFLSVQPQGVDPEQAWRNLLDRVGSNVGVPSGFGGAGAASSSLGRGEAMRLPPPGEHEEYMDASFARAVERFQGTDQGGRDEPLTELQRLQRNPMYAPGQRPHLGPFDPSTEISLAGFSYLPSSSGSKSRAPAPASSSDRQRRILRPHAPRPGLWFTLQVSNAQPEASPLQQIPTAYIRVVDANMTVAAVRRYLVNKLELASEDEVELTCKGQPLQLSMPLSQVRDGIWQSPITNTATPSTPQLLSEGKAWKARDGSITLVGDVVMVLTYGRRPQAPRPASA